MNDENDETLKHIWEYIKMSDGRRVKRCQACLYSYAFGFDLPCPGRR